MKDCASTPLVSDDLLTELAHPACDGAGEFLSHLDRLPPEARLDAFVQETIRTGGTYVVPGRQNFPASHLVELSLHGITASGFSEHAALNEWIRCARRATKQVAA